MYWLLNSDTAILAELEIAGSLTGLLFLLLYYFIFPTQIIELLILAQIQTTNVQYKFTRNGKIDEPLFTSHSWETHTHTQSLLQW